MAKFDEFIDNLSNYENLDYLNTAVKLYSPFYKKRKKHFTEKLLNEGIIDEEFIMMINSFTLEELVLLKLEQIYEHFKINMKLNVPLFMNKIESTLIMVINDYFDENQINNLFINRAKIRINERRFNKTK